MGILCSDWIYLILSSNACLNALPVVVTAQAVQVRQLAPGCTLRVSPKGTLRVATHEMLRENYTNEEHKADRSLYCEVPDRREWGACRNVG
ncbi:MAG: hypothetical protein KKD28_03020 [Chloroflexi bacterium]|nr:hypothetical protein [Chloroflexota bacterium]MBU1660426.1 hypothetical protein [Chloroflexota bacterium]